MLTKLKCEEIRRAVEERVRKRLGKRMRMRKRLRLGIRLRLDKRLRLRLDKRLRLGLGKRLRLGIRLRLRDAVPSDVLASITIDLMRFSTPFFVFADDAPGPVLVRVHGLDGDALTDLRELLKVSRLTLGQAIERAASPVTRATLNTIYCEELISAQKAWALAQLNAKRITGADVPVATAKMEPEFEREVLARLMSAIVRARGNMVVPLLQALILPTYERLRPYYVNKGYLTDKLFTPRVGKTRRKRLTARYGTDLLTDIGDLVTAHWGHVIGRVDYARVSSCVQKELERAAPAES